MVHSNGVETTKRHILYWNVPLFSGINLVRGWAKMFVINVRDLFGVCSECSLTGNCEVDAGTFIFFETWIRHCFVAFFLECNNNQSNENIYKKEWEHNKEHFLSIWRTRTLYANMFGKSSEMRNRSYVENRNFNSIIFQWSHVWFCCFYWIPKYIWPS